MAQLSPKAAKAAVLEQHPEWGVLPGALPSPARVRGGVRLDPELFGSKTEAKQKAGFTSRKERECSDGNAPLTVEARPRFRRSEAEAIIEALFGTTGHPT